MAVTRSYKQACPSCETMVLVKDVSMVGKKIECPRCKDKFVVEKPSVKKPADDEDDEDLEETPKKQAKAGAKKPAVQVKKNGKPKADEDDDEELITEEVEDEEVEEEEKPKGKNKDKKDAKKKDTKSDDEDEEDEEDDGKKKKKDKKKAKAGGSKKLQIQVAVAVVGVLVLGIAGYLIVGRSPSTGGSGGQAKGGGAPPPPPLQTPETDPDKKGDEPKKVEKNDTPPELSGPPPDPAGPELTNLLPPDSEFVFRGAFNTLLDNSSPFRQTAFSPPGTFDEAVLAKLVGFPVANIDEVLHARRYSAPAWMFTVVHVMDNLSKEKLTKALDLKPASSPIKNQEYFQVVGGQTLIERLGGMSLGVPPSLRFLAAGEKKPLFVYLHNRQTLIFADEVPMTAFLQAEGQFPYADEKATPKKEEPKKAGLPMIPGGKEPPPPLPGKEGPPLGKDAKPPMIPDPGKVDPGKADPGKGDGKGDKESTTRSAGTFMTIKPALKKLLEQIETKVGENDKILFLYASDLNAARIPPRKGDLKDTVVFYPPPVWDLTTMLRGDRSRWTSLAAGLIQKEGNRNFQYVNEFLCKQDADARDLQKDMVDTTAPQIGQFLLHLLEHKVVLPVPLARVEGTGKLDNFPGGMPKGEGFPKVDPKAGFDPLKEKTPMPAAGAENSSIQVTQEAKKVSFIVNLVMDNAAYTRTIELLGLLVAGAKAEVTLAAGTPAGKHGLAAAGKEMAVKGLSELEVAPGHYPPGAFIRPPTNVRSAKEPNNRVSWMAGLLPYIGHEPLFKQVNFKQSWRDAVNWSPGRNLVPEFLDPTYPDSSRYVMLPDLPVEYGATHFVGVAGVGLDAAFYPANDPAFDGKRGILAYDHSASLEEVQKGRGLSNTILMMQVPYDSMVGTTPWMAGGGSTLRGVPEKSSIEPFVLTRDKDGKAISHQGRAGTYALMADGSVRFIAKSVPDAVFQAMCTYKGPAPADFNLDKNANTPLLPGPATESKKMEKQAPSKTDPKKATAPTKKSKS